VARQAGRFEEIIPGWVFVVRGTVARQLVALAVTATVVTPFWVADEPPDLRLGPLLVLGLVVVAALAGWWPAAIAGAVVVPT
jgi:4-amino-4-deoxy-L-arabinose transferase-like glycosyltransferase